MARPDTYQLHRRARVHRARAMAGLLRNALLVLRAAHAALWRPLVAS